ncbi:hypothetical protein CRG98_000748 [Punica granatum]|uniref:Uncharacterized protein n=1 Tax=Punica granatum TaxID=22663 RepID=A0A2I0LDY2_PUNGR|nr:hypothetical protein CRG98_000748 [Punica granatum]
MKESRDEVWVLIDRVFEVRLFCLSGPRAQPKHHSHAVARSGTQPPKGARRPVPGAAREGKRAFRWPRPHDRRDTQSLQVASSISLAAASRNRHTERCMTTRSRKNASFLGLGERNPSLRNDSGINPIASPQTQPHPCSQEREQGLPRRSSDFRGNACENQRYRAFRASRPPDYRGGGQRNPSLRGDSSTHPACSTCRECENARAPASGSHCQPTRPQAGVRSRVVGRGQGTHHQHYTVVTVPWACLDRALDVPVVRTRMWTLVGARIARFWIARLGVVPNCSDGMLDLPTVLEEESFALDG